MELVVRIGETGGDRGIALEERHLVPRPQVPLSQLERGIEVCAQLRGFKEDRSQGIAARGVCQASPGQLSQEQEYEAYPIPSHMHRRGGDRRGGNAPLGRCSLAIQTENRLRARPLLGRSASL